MLLSPTHKSESPPKAPGRFTRVLFEHTLLRVFTLSTTLRRLLWGGGLTALLLVFVLWHTPEFFLPEAAWGGTLYVLCLLSCVILGLLTTLRWKLTSRRAAYWVSGVVVALLPIVAMTMVECLNGVFTGHYWSPQTLLHNYVLYLLFYGVVYILSGSFRWPMLVMNPLFFLLSLTNYYVMAFRGTPFIPIDFLAAGTAANVLSAYDLSFNYLAVTATLMLVALTVFAAKLVTPPMDIVWKIASRVFFATLTVSIVCIYFFTDVYAQIGLKPDFWNQARGYRNTGVVLNFCLNTKYIFNNAPSGYRADEVDDLLAATLGEAPDTPGDSQGTTPNIICIMNESLADMDVLGDVQTNVDYMPFLRSLTENTVRGNLYVPVIGSGTSNTEFEFLTGVSTSFFPAGSNAYMLYVKERLPSLVSTLMDQGYSSRAFHPYYASGWNRTAVYNHFGFSRFTSLGSVISNTILAQYSASGANTEVLIDLVEEAYPGEDILLRRYVSDSCNYRELIEMYENRNREQPFFLFNVTMQNHGGYTEQASNFTEDVYVTGLPDGVVYPKANQFFSLMKKSDEAFAELIGYFENVKEPTVICLFGDHQPSIENAYIASLLGVNNLYSLPTEVEQKRYITPFYIWANYDIPEQEIERLSVNYLSSYVMQVAGVQMPAYNRYLLKLSETLPVLNNVGHIDADGNVYAASGHTPYADLLADYEKIAYNYILDSQGRQNQLYYLNP